jgi:hypothetical protein
MENYPKFSPGDFVRCVDLSENLILNRIYQVDRQDENYLYLREMPVCWLAKRFVLCEVSKVKNILKNYDKTISE